MDAHPGERRSGGPEAIASSRETCLENAPIAEHLEAIRGLCQEFGVARLEVFGSVCTPDFDPEQSDIDFLVEYPADYDFGPWLTRYLQPIRKVGEHGGPYDR